MTKRKLRTEDENEDRDPVPSYEEIETREKPTRKSHWGKRVILKEEEEEEEEPAEKEHDSTM